MLFGRFSSSSALNVNTVDPGNECPVDSVDSADSADSAAIAPGVIHINRKTPRQNVVISRLFNINQSYSIGHASGIGYTLYRSG